MIYKREILVLKEHDKKKVLIENDGYGLYMLITQNGSQWSGSGVDDELLEMIIDSINEYFEKLRTTAPVSNVKKNQSDLCVKIVEKRSFQSIH